MGTGNDFPLGAVLALKVFAAAAVVAARFGVQTGGPVLTRGEVTIPDPLLTMSAGVAVGADASVAAHHVQAGGTVLAWPLPGGAFIHVFLAKVPLKA